MEQNRGLAKPEQLSERVQRLRAPNPGPMTLTGTNTYLVGSGREMVVIDPGPQIESHLQAIVAVSKAQQKPVRQILVTHGHPDHFPGAEQLSKMTGAPVVAYREATFPHQDSLDDRQRVTLDGATLLAIYTPGHAIDHLCFYLEEEQALFTGDNILGQGTTVIAPPKGDMSAYLASLRLLEENWASARVIYGGHGPEVTAPDAKIREYILHRQARQQQLEEALQRSSGTIPQLVEQIYQDVDRRLWPAAARQVLAYLIMLEDEGRVTSEVISSAELSATDVAMLNPATTGVDPVAAAELGISGQPGSGLEKVKKYSLTT
ncbi:MAG TPA: MBL fold metallo-hydrolase [Chloroflexia bacterium]|nr:MBL fold metallo-hydrolase [Chloroflexia bacterium]